jgi:hypothetical protein
VGNDAVRHRDQRRSVVGRRGVLTLERHGYRSGLLALAPREASPLVEASLDE